MTDEQRSRARRPAAKSPKIVFKQALNDIIKRLPRRASATLLLATSLLLAGCQSESGGPGASAAPSAATPDLDTELARALISRRPVFVLVAESGLSREDDRALLLFETLAAQGKLDGVVPIVLDLAVSRNRAMAARFHATNTPALFGLSPRGLIVTRDETSITKALILSRVGEIAERGREPDAKLALLDAAVARNANDPAAQWELADFLLARKNAREAVSHLEIVARNEAAGATLRVRAWVELARAHLWIAEPEKGRHEANDLIAVLGPKTPDALAGGNLVLGLQDANAKRAAVARREFQAAIAAAPESVYARQAAGALAKLPRETK